MSTEISSFFSKIPKSSSTDLEDLCFILVNEFHWTQEDIIDTEVPFIFQLLNARKRSIDRQNKESKRRK
jgi:hypothetical protein